MDTTRTVPADVADLAASWLAGLALAFENCQLNDDYLHEQAGVNADWLRQTALELGGPDWVASAPGRELRNAQGVDETLVQILMAIDSGTVPRISWPGSGDNP